MNTPEEDPLVIALMRRKNFAEWFLEGFGLSLFFATIFTLVMPSLAAKIVGFSLIAVCLVICLVAAYQLGKTKRFIDQITHSKHSDDEYDEFAKDPIGYMKDN